MAKQFVRHAIHKKKKLAAVWRRPRGLQNKMRLHKKGHLPQISTGYGAPNEEKGKIKGKVPVLVNNVTDLTKVNSKSIVIISSKLGVRKKVEIVKLCADKKYEVLNVKDSKSYLQTVSDRLLKNKTARDSKLKEKEVKKTKLEKESDKKESENIDSKVSEGSEEEKKKKEKSEKDKILTTKE